MSEYIPITVPLSVSSDTEALIVGVSSDSAAVPVQIGAAYGAGDYDLYDGPYTVTPGPQAQVLETAGKAMREDVTVEPIPTNYGLITWNGSFLTVS